MAKPKIDPEKKKRKVVITMRPDLIEKTAKGNRSRLIQEGLDLLFSGDV